MSNCTLFKNPSYLISSFSKFLFSKPLCLLLIALSCNSTIAAQEEKQRLLVNGDRGAVLESVVVGHRRPTPVVNYQAIIPPVQYAERVLIEVNPGIAQKQWNTIADLVTLVCDKRYYGQISRKYKETAPAESINSYEKLIDYLKPQAWAALTQEPLFSSYQQGLRLQTNDLIKAIKEFITSDELLRKQNKALLRDIEIYLEQLSEKASQLDEKDRTIEELQTSRNRWRGTAIAVTLLSVVGVAGTVFLTHYFWRS